MLGVNPIREEENEIWDMVSGDRDGGEMSRCYGGTEVQIAFLLLNDVPCVCVCCWQSDRELIPQR